MHTKNKDYLQYVKVIEQVLIIGNYIGSRDSVFSF